VFFLIFLLSYHLSYFFLPSIFILLSCFFTTSHINLSFTFFYFIFLFILSILFPSFPQHRDESDERDRHHRQPADQRGRALGHGVVEPVPCPLAERHPRRLDLRAGVEDNLATLGVEQLGAVNLRRMHEHGVPADQVVALEDQLAEMIALRDEGKIGGIGISTAPLAEVQAVSSEIVCVQDPYSLLAQDDGGVLDHCIQAGIAFVPYFPLGERKSYGKIRK